MVEGPTAHKFAYDISRLFKHREIKDVYIKSKKVYIDLERLKRRKILGSEAYGKNILIHLDGYTIRLHLMLYGTIHLQSIGEELKKPFNRVRLQIKTDEYMLTVYNAPIVEIGETKEIWRIIRENYGPDPLRKDWDREEAYRNLIKNTGQTISKALLDQSIIAGIGNILRNEILYRAKTHPEIKVGELNDKKINRILDYVENLSREWLELKLKGERLKPLLKVYNKYRGKCIECGSKIVFYIQEDIGRKTFYCPKCQEI